MAPSAGDQLTVFLATIGQGDAVWERFGHNTIWIHDAETGSTISYNYGIFDSAQPGFIPRFLRGRMQYTMAAHDAQRELAHYQESNRSVWLQRLNLTSQQKHALRQFLEWNWLPENREYLYHYFYDNCSTRVRDALDSVLAGAIRSHLEPLPTNTTYRWHSLRLTGENIPVYTGLSLGLGKPTDVPISAWEESFIPMQLMKHLRGLRVTGANGEQIPLIAEERTLFEATRSAEAAAPPNRWFAFMLFSSLLGGGLLVLARRARTRQRAALALAVSLSTWGVIVGFFGLILTLLWAVTDHTTSYNNQNLLQVNPLGFLLAVAAPLAVLRRSGGRSLRIARLAWPTALLLPLLSALGLLLDVINIGQANGPIIALVLPLHLATVLSLYHVREPDLSLREDVAARMTASAAA